jgi:hypothetical protein
MTAQEFFGKHFNGLHYDEVTPERIEQYAIEFCKLNINTLLEDIINDIPHFEVKDTINRTTLIELINHHIKNKIK